jgi:HAD superfamily hydrolase (TIGR01509 family)
MIKTHPLLQPAPEAILFDADGTLFESEKLSFEASRLTALEVHGFELTWEMFEQNVIRDSKNTNELLEMHGLVVDPEQIQLKKRGYLEQLINEQLEPMPGVTDFLSWCSQYAVRCVVVSANRQTALRTSLQKLDIAQYFKEIISFEDTGTRRKPDPHPYQLGLILAGVMPEHALAVEDTAKGISSAHGAGLQCIGIRNEVNSEADLADAELIINDYRELLV